LAISPARKKRDRRPVDGFLTFPPRRGWPSTTRAFVISGLSAILDVLLAAVVAVLQELPSDLLAIVSRHTFLAVSILPVRFSLRPKQASFSPQAPVFLHAAFNSSIGVIDAEKPTSRNRIVFPVHKRPAGLPLPLQAFHARSLFLSVSPSKPVVHFLSTAMEPANPTKTLSRPLLSHISKGVVNALFRHVEQVRPLSHRHRIWLVPLVERPTPNLLFFTLAPRAPFFSDLLSGFFVGLESLRIFRRSS